MVLEEKDVILLFWKFELEEIECKYCNTILTYPTDLPIEHLDEQFQQCFISLWEHSVECRGINPKDRDYLRSLIPNQKDKEQKDKTRKDTKRQKAVVKSAKTSVQCIHLRTFILQTYQSYLFFSFTSSIQG